MDIKTHKSLTALKPTQKEVLHNVVNVPRLFIIQRAGVNGGLSWLFRYNRPFINTPNKITLGKAGKFKDGALNVAGMMTLAEATAKANEYNALLVNDIDPQAHETQLESEHKQKHLYTFEYFANLHYDSLKDLQATGTLLRKRGRYDLLIKDLGAYPIEQIKPSTLQAVLVKIQENSKSADDEYTDKAHRIATIASEIFHYAEGITDKPHNPTDIAKRKLKPYFYGNRKGITNPSEFAQMIRDIETLPTRGYPLNVVNSLRLLSLLFVRNGDLRRMKWSDIDFNLAVWNLKPLKSESSNKIKMVQFLTIPLPRQAIAILREQQAINGGQDYVFYNEANRKEPYLDTNASNLALQDIGYKDRHTTHGFRASGKSFLKGLFKYPNEFIEMALGHIVKDPNGTAYDRWQYLDERREMLQFYADWIDTLKVNGDTSQFIPYDKRHLINDPKQFLLSAIGALSEADKAELITLLNKP